MTYLIRSPQEILPKLRFPEEINDPDEIERIILRINPEYGKIRENPFIQKEKDNQGNDTFCQFAIFRTMHGRFSTYQVLPHCETGPAYKPSDDEIYWLGGEVLRKEEFDSVIEEYLALKLIRQVQSA